MTIAATTKDQFLPRGVSLDLYEVVGDYWLSVERLEYQFEATVIERRAGCFLHLNNPLAQALFRQLQRTMIAIRIVAGLSE